MNISTTVQSNQRFNHEPSPRDPEPLTRDPRKRGAPKGNKNAARHGFYSRQSLEANLAFLKEHTDLGRADREIFLAARTVNEVKLRDPSNELLYSKALNCFLKLVMRKYGIANKHDDEALSFALAQVERDILFPPDQMAALLKQLV